jgi:hypothetical protein
MVLALSQGNANNQPTQDLSGGELCRLNPGNGNIIWYASIPASEPENVALAGNIAVLGGLNRGMFGVNVGDGSIRWENTNINNNAGNEPVTAVKDGKAYTLGQLEYLTEFDTQTGKVVVSTPLEPAKASTSGVNTTTTGVIEPAGNSVYYVTGMGRLERVS